jgi:hypothetical protein
MEGAIYIDRSVRGFQVVWDYMLGDLVNLEAMSESELVIVREEADFYQVHSLLKLLAPPPPQFSTDYTGPQVSFYNKNTVLTRVAETSTDNSYVMCTTLFVIPDNATLWR